MRWERAAVRGREQAMSEVLVSEPEVAVPAPGEPEAPGLTRRGLLATAWRRAAVVGGAVGAAGLVTSCQPSSDQPAFHVLRRLTYGVSTESLDHMGAVGLDAWLAEQLAPDALDHAALDAKLAAFPALGLTAAQLAAAYPSPSQEPGLQLRVASFLRQVHSPAQVFERMVELWSDHFNVPVTDTTSSWLKVVEDREVIRRHALGTFSDLLLASAQSPAMLLYLDNAVSVASAPNENYGRELLELHTVGVDGGYTEADVKATARLLTGWTIDRSTGLFRFDDRIHDKGALTIMGWVRPAGTAYQDHGRQFLQWLARHPKTARQVATKIARRFVGDQPDAGLVADLAAVYSANDTAIAPVLRALVAHPVFLASARKRFRRPLHQLAAVTRSLDADLRASTSTVDLQVLGGLAISLGQVPFNWPAPNGYPDAEGAWLTTGGLLARWNAIGALCSNLPQVVADWAKLAAGLGGKTPAQVVDGLAATALHEPVTAAQRDAIVADLLPTAPPTLTQAQAVAIAPAVAALLHAIPDAQFC